MVQIKRIIMWITLIIIALLTLFSIFGAFLGTDRAYDFFNSIPLTLFWIIFLILPGVGIGLFRRLLRSPPLLLVHLGCIAILLGAMWGSERGHQLQKKLFGINKIRTGSMIIYEGMQEHRILKKNVDFRFGLRNDSLVFFENNKPVHDEDERIFKLPFEIKLNDFRMEYYDSPRLIVKAMNEEEIIIESIKIGKKYPLTDQIVLMISDIYKNFKLRRKNDHAEAYDQEGPGSNPAIRVIIIYPDGLEIEQFIFANYPGHMKKIKEFSFQYQVEGAIRDYFSDLQVIEKGKIIREKPIQVNDPLYYGGYHFYQHSYDSQGGTYSVLMVTSDTGLYFVFAGYFLLMIGILWQMWVIPGLRHLNFRSKEEKGNHGT